MGLKVIGGEVVSKRLLYWSLVLSAIHVLGFANWTSGPFRLWSPLMNYIVMVVVFTIPAAIAVLSFGIRRPIFRTVIAFIVLPWVLFCAIPLLGAVMSLGDIIASGSDPSFEYLHSTTTGASRVSVYRTNGGATTDYGVAFRHELAVLPGLRVTKQYAGFDHCYDGYVQPTGNLEVTLSCSQPTRESARGVPSGGTRVQLRPHVVF